MKFIIPRKIRELKIHIWRNFSLYDLFVLFGSTVLIIVCVISISTSFWVRVILGIILMLIAFSLIITWIPRKKGWEVIILMLTFLFLKKKKINFENILNFKKLDDYTGIINDKFFCCALEIVSEFENFSEKIFLNKLEQLEKIFNTCRLQFKIIKIENNFDLQNHKNFVQQIKKNNAQQVFILNSTLKSAPQHKDLDKSNHSNLAIQQEKKRQSSINKKVKEYLLQYKEIEKNNNLQKTEFYFIFYSKSKKFLTNEINALKENMKKERFIVEKVILNKIVDIFCKTLNKDEKTTNKIKAIKKDYLCINRNSYTKIYNLYNFPFEVEKCWLNKILHLKDCSFVLNFQTIKTFEAKKNLNKAIQDLYVMSYTKTDEIEKRDIHFQLRILNKLVDEITEKNRKLFNLDMYLIINADSYQSLKKKCMLISNKISREGVKLDSFLYQQFQALEAIFINGFEHIYNSQEIPVQTFVAGYPFLIKEINDEKGLLLGYNNKKYPLFFQQTKITSHRTNFNQLVIGTSGSGKSFMIKKEIIFQIISGYKLMIIDPENEYHEIAELFGGNIIDFSNGTKIKINPLQIVVGIKNDYQTRTKETLDKNITEHLQFLEEFFCLSCGELKRNEINLLLICVRKLYKKFGLFSEQLVFKNDDYPIFQDLYDLIKKESKIVKNKKLHERLEELLLILSRFIDGGIYSFLWNNITNIDFRSNKVNVFNLNSLTQTGNKKLINTQIFLLMRYIEDYVRENRIKNFLFKKQVNIKRSSWISIIIDEAHLLINKDYPIALNFIYQLVKRIRKYKGLISIITQNLNDFLGSETIKRYATAIINLSQYLKIMHLQPNDLKILEDLYKQGGNELLEEEKKFIINARTGDCLFIIDSEKRTMFKVNEI